MLDGTTNEADARLIADINAADPFDGGCAADVEQAPETPKPLNERDDFLDYLRDKMHQQRRLGIQEGMERAAQMCINGDQIKASDIILREIAQING